MVKYVRTIENRKKISDSLKKYFSNPKIKEKLSIRNSGERNPHYGKHHSFEHRKKMHKLMSGEKNHEYKHGNGLRGYDFKFNEVFKKSIKQRDRGCMLCNIGLEDLKLLKRKVNVHHINYDIKLSIPENCITLCNSCHSKTNGNREEFIEFFHSILNKKYGYNYDGGLVVLNTSNEHQI